MKPRYQIVISLSEQDNKQLAELRRTGLKIVDIFRMGISGALNSSRLSRNPKKPHSSGL